MSRDVTIFHATEMFGKKLMYIIQTEYPTTGKAVKEKINEQRDLRRMSIVPLDKIVLIYQGRQIKDNDVIDGDMIEDIRKANGGLKVRFLVASPPSMREIALETAEADTRRQTLLDRAKYKRGHICMADEPFIANGRITDIKIVDDKVVYVINGKEVEEAHVFLEPSKISDKSSEYYRVSVALKARIQAVVDRAWNPYAMSSFVDNAV